MNTIPLVVVQNNFVQHLTAPVAEAARAMGISLHDVSSGEQAALHPLPPGDHPWGPILVIGGIIFVHQWARNVPALTSWVFWDDVQYDALVWKERMGQRYLNADGDPTTIGDFTQSSIGARHLRPRSGIKMLGDRPVTESKEGRESISGLVATPQDVARLNIDPATRIWVSEPKDIDGEVRVWMIDGRVAAASAYRIDGKHDRRCDHPFVEAAILAANECHSIWHPGRHYVVDFAMTKDGMRIVEYNPIHSSGWYAAEPADVIKAFMAAHDAILK